MADPITFGDLLRKGLITRADIAAAVDAYFANPETARFVVGDGYVIELAAAVRDNILAEEMLTDEGIHEHWKRSAVLTAILLARPVKG